MRATFIFEDVKQNRATVNVLDVPDLSTAAQIANSLKTYTNAKLMSASVTEYETVTDALIGGTYNSCYEKAVMTIENLDVTPGERGRIIRIDWPAPVDELIEHTDDGYTVVWSQAAGMTNILATQLGKTLEFKRGWFKGIKGH